MRRRKKTIMVTEFGLGSLRKGCNLLESFTTSTQVVLVGGAFQRQSDLGGGPVMPVRFNELTGEYEIEWSQ